MKPNLLIRRLMQEAGLTERDVISRTGLAQSNFNAALNDKRGISKQMALKLGPLLGVPVELLLSEDPEWPTPSPARPASPTTDTAGKLDILRRYQDPAWRVEVVGAIEAGPPTELPPGVEPIAFIQPPDERWPGARRQAWIVRDNSCDRVCGPNSFLITVPIDQMGRDLQAGDLLVMDFILGEITLRRVGKLGLDPDGALFFFPRTSDANLARPVPMVRTGQAAPAASGPGFSEAQMPWLGLHEPEAQTYQPVDLGLPQPRGLVIEVRARL